MSKIPSEDPQPDTPAQPVKPLDELERLFDELHEQAGGEAPLRNPESLSETIATTYQEREDEQL